MMKVLVTGADGFVAKNLIVKLDELSGFDVLRFTRHTAADDLPELLMKADAVVHLAGVNRPHSAQEFATGNAGLTEHLCAALLQANTARDMPLPVVFSSSTQAMQDSPYGSSKHEAEAALWRYAQQTGAQVFVYRLPNVFGKWCRPNYNSAVATFCHNITRGLPIQINDPAAALTLVYVDDVVAEFVHVLQNLNVQGAAPRLVDHVCKVPVEYATTVGAVAKQIKAFAASRDSLVSEPVGTGLVRALYATYVSYLPPEAFVYGIPKYGDSRGVFVEMLKTKDSGQFSFFTAHPGITRGGHYHHSKTEKFLVIKGQARFGFRHILTNAMHEIVTSGETPQIVETVPGWTHDITNVGPDEMVVMLWANEIFDRERPDTIASQVNL